MAMIAKAVKGPRDFASGTFKALGTDKLLPHGRGGAAD